MSMDVACNWFWRHGYCLNRRLVAHELWQCAMPDPRKAFQVSIRDVWINLNKTVSERTVQRAISDLVDLGVLHLEKPGWGKSAAVYRIVFPPEIESQVERAMGEPMSAIFRIENMAEAERALWECVPADRYADIDEIAKRCHDEEVPANRHSLLAKLHAMRKCGYVDGHEKRGHWLFRRNDPRVRHIQPALVGVKAPETPKPSPVMLLKSEIAEAAQVALDLAARLDKLQAGLAHLADSQAALTELVEENARMKKELEALAAVRSALRTLSSD